MESKVKKEKVFKIIVTEFENNKTKVETRATGFNSFELTGLLFKTLNSLQSDQENDINQLTE